MHVHGFVMKSTTDSCFEIRKSILNCDGLIPVILHQVLLKNGSVDSERRHLRPETLHTVLAMDYGAIVSLAHLSIVIAIIRC